MTTPGAPGSGTMRLAWTPARAGLTYRVFLNAQDRGPTKATSFAFTGLHCNVSRTFSVETVDATGSVSALAGATATTPAC